MDVSNLELGQKLIRLVGILLSQKILDEQDLVFILDLTKSEADILHQEMVEKGYGN